MGAFEFTLDGRGSLLERLLDAGAPLAHDCGGTLACASCCVIVRSGSEHLAPASEDELDMLERAGVDGPRARLACQVRGAGTVAVEIPRVADPGPANAAGISIGAQAAGFLAAQLAKQPGAVAVRLGVEPSGCSGFGYRLDAIEAIRADDTVFESGGVRVAVDPLSLPYLQGTKLELVREGLARRLRFENPNARQRCGCGESFGT